MISVLLGLSEKNLFIYFTSSVCVDGPAVSRWYENLCYERDGIMHFPSKIPQYIGNNI